MKSSEFKNLNFEKKPKKRAKAWKGIIETPLKDRWTLDAERCFHRPLYHLTYMKEWEDIDG